MKDNNETYKTPYALSFKVIKDALNRLEGYRKDIPEPFNKMSMFTILFEMAWCLALYGININDYFGLQLYKYNHRGRKSFISSHRDWFKLTKGSNAYSNYDLFEDKTKFAEKFADLLQREVFAVKNGVTTEQFLQFADKLHSNGTNRFIFKPSDGNRGKGIFAFDYEQAEEKFNYIKESVLTNENETGIIEPIIENEESLKKIHPQSLNTFRIPTFIDKEGNLSIIGAYLRIGRGDSVVDNFAAGGMVTEVDLETGIAITPGIDKHAREYVVHPDTKEQIIGIHIPFWEEAKKLVVDSAKRIPEMRYLSWDVAITPTGPVIIECNFGGDTDVQQIPRNRGLKHKYNGVFK